VNKKSKGGTGSDKRIRVFGVGDTDSNPVLVLPRGGVTNLS